MSTTTLISAKKYSTKPGAIQPAQRLADADLVAALQRFASPDGVERSGNPVECALFNYGWIRAMPEEWHDGSLCKPWRITPAGKAWLSEHSPAESVQKMHELEAAQPASVVVAATVQPVCMALVPASVYERAWQEYQPRPGIRAVKQALGGLRYWPVDYPNEPHGFPSPAAAAWFLEFMRAGEPLCPRNSIGQPLHLKLELLSVGIGRAV